MKSCTMLARCFARYVRVRRAPVCLQMMPASRSIQTGSWPTPTTADTLNDKTPDLSSTNFHLAIQKLDPLSLEEAERARQLASVKESWSQPRWHGIKRPYSAEDVVSKRGTLQVEYPSSLMAKKLLALLREHQAQGTALTTCG